MSWLYSQALGEAFLEENSWDGEPFAQLNVMPTQHKFWRNDKMMEFSNLSQFGLTCAVLTEQHGEALLTWYLEAFHAKTLAQQEKVQESKASAVECGKKWRGLLAKYDQSTHSWKTAQCSLLEDLELSLQTWPRWGSMRNGECYLQPMLAHHIEESASGYWATPTTMDKLPPKSEKSLHREATVSRPGRAKPANLRDQVSNMQNWKAIADTPSGNWPTPTCADTRTDKLKSTQQTPGSMHSVSLAQAVQMWPTPQASDNRDRGNLSSPCVQRRVEIGKQVSLSQSVSEVSGALNPTWVEWLMGWPIGWTDLKPLGMDKSHCVQQQHLSCLKRGLSEVA